jgi:hypothetical protein
MDLAASLVAFMYGLFAGVPRGHRNRARRFKMTVLQPRQILTSELPQAGLHTIRTHALFAALGHS